MTTRSGAAQHNTSTVFIIYKHHHLNMSTVSVKSIQAASTLHFMLTNYKIIKVYFFAVIELRLRLYNVRRKTRSRSALT